jgi:TonB family protein
MTSSGKRVVGLVLIVALQILILQPILAQQASGSMAAAQRTRATTSASIELLTDPEGLDFKPFLQSVYTSVKREWNAGMPPSVELGDLGRVTLQFHVQQDGTVPEDSLKVRFTSGKKHLDEAALQAMRNAAPFKHLPEKFSQPFVELRMTFYYNLAPKSSGVLSILRPAAFPW